MDFDEVFAPVVRMEIVWLLIAMAAHGGWEVHHMDIKLAFLNGELAEEVFVEQPPVSSMTSMGIWCSSYARHCTVCGKRRGLGIPSWTAPWYRLVSNVVPRNTSCIEEQRVDHFY